MFDDVLGQSDPQWLRAPAAFCTRGPVGGDHDKPLARFDDLEDDLEDVACGVAQVHDVRALFDGTKPAVVVGE